MAAILDHGWSLSGQFSKLCPVTLTSIQDGRLQRTYCSFNIGPYGKNVSKCFFSETTWTVETKLPRNDHWKVLCFLCRSEIQDGCHHRSSINIKNTKFVKDLPMIDAQFRFNQCNSFREEYISVFSPYGSVLIL
jgi:hypothetical protein